MKNQETIYVVGNRFSSFSNHNYVYTFDDFFYFANKKLVGNTNTSYKIVVGQGLSQDEHIYLKSFLDIPGIKKFFAYIPDEFLKKKASKQLTHKHKEENILISEPVMKNNYYESLLMCDDQCAEMQDHLTGEHLQAMLLTEAARQMMTATAELYWLDKRQRGTKNFVLNNLSLKFIHYVFPLDVKINLTQLSIRKDSRGNFKSEVKIDFIQQDQVMLQCQGDFSAMDKPVLGQIEKMMAQQCIMHYAKKESFLEQAA